VSQTEVDAAKIAPSPDEPGKMSEDGSQGESGDLDPTQKTTFTLDLVPGNYVLICNQPAHYLLGMHIAFTVKQRIVLSTSPPGESSAGFHLAGAGSDGT